MRKYSILLCILLYMTVNAQFDNSKNENYIAGNNWSVVGSTASYGVQFLSTGALDMSLNVFDHNIIYVNSDCVIIY